VALAPLIIFLIAKEEGLKGLVKSGLISATTTLILISPFKWRNPIEFLMDIYITGYGGYPYTSINAFNIWALHGFWKSDNTKLFFLDFFTVGWLLFVALTAFSLYYLSIEPEKWKENKVIFTAFVLLFGFFMLPTRIHERYLFPVFSVLTLMMPFIRDIKKIYGILSLTYLANQIIVLIFLNRGEYLSNSNPLILPITTINILMFLFTLNRTRMFCT
jgi:hypothetical protein